MSIFFSLLKKGLPPPLPFRWNKADPPPPFIPPLKRAIPPLQPPLISHYGENKIEETKGGRRRKEKNERERERKREKERPRGRKKVQLLI
jgi:hypothetical protein